MQYFIAFFGGRHHLPFTLPAADAAGLPQLLCGRGRAQPPQDAGGRAGLCGRFTVVFVLMGALAGTAGQLLQQYHTAVNIVCGAVVIFFGLCYLGVIKLTLFRAAAARSIARWALARRCCSASCSRWGWTPCVGAFLGSALALASQQGHVLVGMAMLLAYSLGLGVPFVLSAVLIDRLKTAFDWVKRHYGVLNRVCGVFLIVVGVLMATGLMGRFLNLLS